ncbi:MAG: efflux transporter periplasmic adaptor subunit [Gammaproteobacteria bacterium]|nr:MAG: efflux transporter periplasmic adaptor subunit [Gammaproteobacteria bacterium]
MSNELNKKSTNSIIPLIVAAVFGSAVTFAGYTIFDGSDNNMSGEPAVVEKKPKYWVAPMDANYRRDKPGKSPMGMDLVPVYEDGGSSSDSGVGTIKISPEVVNNLGVRTAMAEYKSMHSRIKTVGYVAYDEEQLIHIHSRVQGWIEKLYMKADGDIVTKNAPLYEIYSPELVNAQEEYLIALDRNNARLIKAAEDRLKALQIPSRAIKNIKKTRQVKQTITFYVPQDGVIDNLNIREGFFVKPSITMMSIGKLDQVWVDAEVFESQSSLVTQGLAVTMSLGYLPGREWQGRVDYVYPTLNPKTRTLKVRLLFENKDRQLKPNMFTQVIIHPNNEGKSLLVPKEAVIRTGSTERVVLALGEGRYKSIEVKVGRYDDKSAEILAGLDEGELVVTSAQFLLDSESSKSSDFKRMHHPLEETTLSDKASESAEIYPQAVDSVKPNSNKSEPE